MVVAEGHCEEVPSSRETRHINREVPKEDLWPDAWVTAHRSAWQRSKAQTRDNPDKSLTVLEWLNRSVEGPEEDRHFPSNLSLRGSARTDGINSLNPGVRSLWRLTHEDSSISAAKEASTMSWKKSANRISITEQNLWAKSQFNPRKVKSTGQCIWIFL